MKTLSSPRAAVWVCLETWPRTRASRQMCGGSTSSMCVQRDRIQPSPGLTWLPRTIPSCSTTWATLSTGWKSPNVLKPVPSNAYLSCYSEAKKCLPMTLTRPAAIFPTYWSFAICHLDIFLLVIRVKSVCLELLTFCTRYLCNSLSLIQAN